MTAPGHWQRARELFEALVDLDPAAAQQQLTAIASREPEVAAEVRSLLAHHSHAGAFLSQPAAERLEQVFDEAPHFDAGATVGTYVVSREIGRGGMGRVYLATDTRLGRAVALKLLPPSLANDPSQRERLRREARVAATLSHPGISTIYALEEFDGHIMIVSEFIDGRSLREEIEADGAASSVAVAQAAVELSDALAAAHAQGITHRDLKPENIMRAADGRLKILDFGLALTPDAASLHGHTRLTMPGAVIGTPAYMAPEQLKGAAADARSDVFALGVVLYEFATGTHPFEAGTPLALAARVLESTPSALSTSRSDLSRSLVDVIHRALSKEPADRPASAAAFRRALDASPSASGDVAAWWRRHQVVAIGLYALVTIAAWLVKEGGSGVSRWAFILIGVLALIAGVFRGHLLFAERTNQVTFPAERRRAGPATLVTDAGIGIALLIDGLLLAERQAVGALLVMGLGIGVVLARVVVEPATTRGAFD